VTLQHDSVRKIIESELMGKRAEPSRPIMSHRDRQQSQSMRQFFALRIAIMAKNQLFKLLLFFKFVLKAPCYCSNPGSIGARSHLAKSIITLTSSLSALAA